MVDAGETLARTRARVVAKKEPEDDEPEVDLDALRRRGRDVAAGSRSSDQVDDARDYEQRRARRREAVQRAGPRAPKPSPDEARAPDKPATEAPPARRGSRVDFSRMPRRTAPGPSAGPQGPSLADRLGGQPRASTVIIGLGVACLFVFGCLQLAGSDSGSSGSSGPAPATLHSGTVAGLGAVPSAARSDWTSVAAVDGSCGPCNYAAVQTGETTDHRWGYERAAVVGSSRFDQFYVFHRRRAWRLAGDWAASENFDNGFCSAPSSYPQAIRRQLRRDHWPCPRSGP